MVVGSNPTAGSTFSSDINPPFAPVLFEFLSSLFAKKQKPKRPLTPADPIVAARQAIYERRLPEDLGNYNVCLADYDSQATLDFLKPELGWSINFYREYIREYAKQIRKRNGQAKLCTVSLQPYLNWLKARGLRHAPEYLDRYVESLGTNP